MSLSMVDLNETKTISKILGSDKTKSRLYDLGFVEGTEVSIVNKLNGNLIVNIKNSRIALDKKLAYQILVE